MSRVAIIGIVGNSAFLQVDHFHKGGETIEAHSMHFEPGGKGFNAAVAAGRYGAEVSFLAAVGTDGAEEIVRFAKEEGIRCSLVKKDGGTAFAAILTDQEGCNHVTVYHGAQLTPDDVESFRTQIITADLLLLSNEVPEPVNIKAVQIAVSHQIPVILNPAPARPLDPYLLEHVTLFTPNEHEQERLEEKENVVVTLGKRGCRIRSLALAIPAQSIAPAVDTTGAGDTFNGVLAAMLAEGAELIDAVKTANIASSIEVTRKGVMASIPKKSEIMTYKEKEL